jgi:hypothetical protein
MTGLFEKDHPQMTPEQKVRKQHVVDTIAKWERRLKYAQTVLAKRRKQLAYYEKLERKAESAARSQHRLRQRTEETFAPFFKNEDVT